MLIGKLLPVQVALYSYNIWPPKKKIRNLALTALNQDQFSSYREKGGQKVQEIAHDAKEKELQLPKTYYTVIVVTEFFPCPNCKTIYAV